MKAVITDKELLARVAEGGHRKSDEYSVERVANYFLSDFKQVRAQPA